MDLHVSQNVTPTDPCGATLANACRNIADAVKVAELSSEVDHIIFLHGKNESQKEAKKEPESCFGVNGTISLSNNYHFKSFNGTRACITSEITTTQHAFKVNSSRSFEAEKLDFKDIGVLSKVDHAGTVIVNSCVVECKVTIIMVESLESIIIKDSFFNISRFPSTYVFTVQVKKKLEHLLLENSVIWGNFLEANRKQMKSLRMLKFELYGAWIAANPIVCKSDCTVVIKDGKVGNCSDCAFVKVWGNDDRGLCPNKSDFSRLEMRDITISNTVRADTFIDLACTVFQMSNIQVSNNVDKMSSFTSYFFYFTDVQGTINHLDLEKSVLRDVMYVWNSKVDINNCRSINLDVTKHFLYMWRSNDIKFHELHFTNSSITTMIEIWGNTTKNTNVLLQKMTSIGNNKVGFLAWILGDGGLNIKDSILNGTKYITDVYSGLIKADESSINLENVLFENVTPDSDTPSEYRHIIQAHGDVVLNNVTLTGCKYDTGVYLIGANVTAHDLKIVNNIGKDHLTIDEDAGRRANPTYQAIMSNVYIANTEYLTTRNQVWNSVLLGYRPERMQMNNVSVKLRSGHWGCLVVHDNNTQKFEDFADVSCPVQFHPVSRKKATSFNNFTCTTCEKVGTNGSRESTRNNIYMTFFALFLLVSWM